MAGWRTELHGCIDVARSRVKVATQGGAKQRELTDAIAFAELRDVAAPTLDDRRHDAIGVFFVVSESHGCFGRFDDELPHCLIADLTNHLARRHITEQRIFCLEPQRGLDYVAIEELRHECASVCDLFQTIDHGSRHFLVEANGSLRDLCYLCDIALVQLEETHDCARVEPVIRPKPKIVPDGYRAKKCCGVRHGSLLPFRCVVSIPGSETMGH